jgi:hypothetical protein
VRQEVDDSAVKRSLMLLNPIIRGKVCTADNSLFLNGDMIIFYKGTFLNTKDIAVLPTISLVKIIIHL